MIGGLGFSELLLIFLIIMLLFGAKKLPEFAKGLGTALREFRKAAREVEDTVALETTAERVLEENKEEEKKKEEEKSEVKEESEESKDQTGK